MYHYHHKHESKKYNSRNNVTVEKAQERHLYELDEEEKDIETAYQESIERARELGVDEEHILDTHEKIDAFFHNN